MSKIVKCMKSFMIFDFHLNTEYLDLEFARVHKIYLEKFSSWTLNSTRRKLISTYWFRQVFVHFSVIIGIALLLTLSGQTDNRTLVSSLIIGGLPSFLIVTAFVYFPTFYSDFLPILDMIIEQREMCTIQVNETKKCKRTQFQTPGLVIIYYALSKVCNIPLLPANDSSGDLLNKLFGTGKDKLKQNLARLYKPSSLSPKERAEMLKGIENARKYFKQIGCAAASNTLQELELELHITNKT